MRALCVMASPISAAVATRWINDGTADTILRFIRSESIARERIAAKALEPGSYLSDPLSFNIWLPMRNGWTRSVFVSQARDERSWRRSKRRLRSEWRAARSRTRRTGRANYAHSGRARAGVPIASPRKATRVRRDVAERKSLRVRTSAGIFAASMALMCMCMRPSVCCCLWLAPINVWRVRPSPSGICNDHPDEYRRPRIVRDAGGGA